MSISKPFRRKTRKQLHFLLPVRVLTMAVVLGPATAAAAAVAAVAMAAMVPTVTTTNDLTSSQQAKTHDTKRTSPTRI